jgi:two-component system sensor histidine kinase KdpD
VGAVSSSHCSGVFGIANILLDRTVNVESATIAGVKTMAQTGLRFAASAAIVLAIVFVFFKLIPMNATTVGFTFLLAILVVSAGWGLHYAIFMSLLATLCFNYFFLQPVLHFTIADPQNWIALCAFLVTAVVASQLAERARREALNADHRRQEAERLYAFSQQLLATDNIAELLNAIPRFVADMFNATSAGMFLAGKKQIYYSDLASQEPLAAQRLEAISGRGEPVIDREQNVCFAPLRMGLRSFGSLGIAGALLSRETLEALGSLVAIAIERAGAVEKLTKTEASRESERLRSALLDAVTHEFRTPLTAIKASAESLLSDFHLDEAQRQELLAVINEESDRLNRLVGEASEMMQLDAGQIKLHLVPHPIQEAIETALQESRQVLAGHPVECQIQPNLPPARMDIERIAEVLNQLLDNAVKYSPPESAIRISAEGTDRLLCVAVADQGAGIDDFEQSLIFDKFYRGQNQRTSVQGTGMGLAIAKSIIEAHGGTIGVTSQLGHGSVFQFSLPVS